MVILLLFLINIALNFLQKDLELLVVECVAFAKLFFLSLDLFQLISLPFELFVEATGSQQLQGLSLDLLNLIFEHVLEEELAFTNLADLTATFVSAHRELSGLPSAVFTEVLGAKLTLFGIFDILKRFFAALTVCGHNTGSPRENIFIDVSQRENRIVRSVRKIFDLATLKLDGELLGL